MEGKGINRSLRHKNNGIWILNVLARAAPPISVIIPHFNQPKQLARCLDFPFLDNHFLMTNSRLLLLIMAQSYHLTKSARSIQVCAWSGRPSWAQVPPGIKA